MNEFVRVPSGLVGQVWRFCAVGVASTIAYLVLYVILRRGIPPQWANALALLCTAVANTAVNRRLTFRVRSPADRLRHQLQGLVVFGLGLALTSTALACLSFISPHASRGVEVSVLVAANVVATAVRFVLFRSWVFTSAPSSALVDLSPTAQNHAHHDLGVRWPADLWATPPV